MSACYDFSLEDPEDTGGTDGAGETGGAQDSTDSAGEGGTSSGCAFDTDCKGDRICVNSRCAEPNASGNIGNDAAGAGVAMGRGETERFRSGYVVLCSA